MASVGAQSAYATDIVAVQRVYYQQKWSFFCNRSLFDFFRSFLNKDHFYFRQLDARHVHPAHWILYWRNCSSLPCRATIYEYVASLSVATPRYLQIIYY